MEHAKPTLVVSRCLGFDACRYDGEALSAPFLAELAPTVDLVPVCPEMEIGLGVPRPPIRIVMENGGRRLVQPSTGLDLTARMTKFRERFLAGTGAVDGFVLKARSPSCGVSDTKVFSGSDHDAPVFHLGPGMFAEAVKARFPGIPVEDEERLVIPAVREEFLARIFASAARRGAKESA